MKSFCSISKHFTNTQYSMCLVSENECWNYVSYLLSIWNVINLSVLFYKCLDMNTKTYWTINGVGEITPVGREVNREMKGENII